MEGTKSTIASRSGSPVEMTLRMLRMTLVLATSAAIMLALCGGTAQAESEFVLKSENLKDLTSITTALENLGLIRVKSNTALGKEALASNTEGSEDTAIGSNALKANTTGKEDTAVGNESDASASASLQDVAIGNGAMRNAATGANGNTAVGNVTLFDATSTAKENVAVGNGALSDYFKESLSGERNTAVGHEAAAGLTSGMKNTDIGFNADDENRTGSGNTAVGTLALGALAEKQPVNNSENTAVGMAAGTHDEDGSGNVFIGYEAGAALKNGSEVLYIDDTPTESPLIFGNFKTNVVKVNGKLEVSEAAAAPSKPTEGEANAGTAAVAMRKTSFAVTGNGTKTKWSLKHGLGTRLVSVTVQKAESEQPGELEQATYKTKPISNGEVEVIFTTAPAAGEEKFLTVTG